MNPNDRNAHEAHGDKEDHVKKYLTKKEFEHYWVDLYAPHSKCEVRSETIIKRLCSELAAKDAFISKIASMDIVTEALHGGEKDV